VKLGKIPIVPGRAHHGWKVVGWEAVEQVHGGALPEAANLGDRLNKARDAAKELCGARTRKRGEFTVGNGIACMVVLRHVAGTESFFVRTITADERIHRIELGVTEESYPKLEVTFGAKLGAECAASFFPKGAAPIGGFLLNVFVCAGKKAHPRPAGNGPNADGHAGRREFSWASGEPLDVRKDGKNAADDKQAVELKHVAGIKPAHDLAGGAGEACIECGVKTLVGLARGISEIGLVFADDCGSGVGGAVIDDDVFEIGIILIENGENGRLKKLLAVVDSGDEGDAGMGCWEDLLILTSRIRESDRTTSAAACLAERASHAGS